MGTEVLRPQNIFSPAAIHHRKRGSYGNGYINPRFGNKKSPAAKERRFENDLKNINTSNLVIGRVRILKRGESPEGIEDVIMSRMMINRLRTDSMIVPKKIRLEDLKGDGTVVDINELMADVYAGSAFSMSPSPRSLPLPSFFNKIQDLETVDDSATRDLRRLLRLE